jgi:hypothetical protein
MAAVAVAVRLTEAHRLAQQRVAAATVARMQAVWPLLDPIDLDGTSDRWLTAAAPVIDTGATTSAKVAEGYIRAFKAAELPGGDQVPAVVVQLPVAEQVATSLLVTGPVQVKIQMTAGVPLQQATDSALASSSRAAMRHALNSGRNYIVDAVQADPQASGWARVTSAKPCAWCAMLASRGPVYKSNDTASFDAHDHCSCSLEPLYRDDAPWPPSAQQWADVWQQAKADSGDTLSVFRQLVTAS